MTYTPDCKSIAINLYNESRASPVIIDSSVALLTEDELSSIVDIAIEIAMRRQRDMPYDQFMDMLVSVCEDSSVI